MSTRTQPVDGRLPQGESATAQPTAASDLQQRLSAIWAGVLGVERVAADDNFFDLGGDSILAVSLQHRLEAEFGHRLQIAELYEHCTIRQQVALLQHETKTQRSLPSGVLALQPEGHRNNIFWLHYLSPHLGKAISREQPVLYVALTQEDFPLLGERPSLQNIASCLLRKVLAAQPQGPYNLGGYCLGGILAYEIACQLRTAGHEVSLVVLVDPPNPSYIEPRDSPKRLVHYLAYAIRRAVRLGLPLSLEYFSEHVRKFFARMLHTKSTKTEMGIAQRMIEAAAMKYAPQEYDGRVLLLLASERPPYVNRLLEWKAVVPGDLRVQYVNSHHRDLFKPHKVHHIADAIVSQLTPGAEDQPVFLSPNATA